MKNKHYTRLQGAEWHSVKDKLKLVGYKMNKGEDRLHIKGFYKDENGRVFTHWMNDREVEEFREEHTPKAHRNTYEAQQLLYELIFDEIAPFESMVESIKILRKDIDDKIQRSFDVDFGRSDKLSDRLFTETIVELQLIIQRLDEILEKGENR